MKSYYKVLYSTLWNMGTLNCLYLDIFIKSYPVGMVFSLHFANPLVSLRSQSCLPPSLHNCSSKYEHSVSTWYDVIKLILCLQDKRVSICPPKLKRQHECLSGPVHHICQDSPLCLILPWVLLESNSSAEWATEPDTMGSVSNCIQCSQCHVI